MIRGRRAFAYSLSLVILASHSITFAQTIDGFSAVRSQEERSAEERFRAVPAPNSAREHLRRLTIDPHVAGTKEDYATAIYVRDQMRSFGLSAELKEYQVWLNYPKTDQIGRASCRERGEGREKGGAERR